MSVWAELKGTIFVNKSSGYSLKKSIEQHFDEYTGLVIHRQLFNDDQGGVLKLSFEFTFCQDGLDAVKEAMKWFESFPKHTTKDITLSVRFL